MSFRLRPRLDDMAWGERARAVFVSREEMRMGMALTAMDAGNKAGTDEAKRAAVSVVVAVVVVVVCV